jgi:pimeloyl-ACP methyl ester carboxylesterase
MPAFTLTNSTNVRNPLIGLALRAELALVSALAPQRAVDIAARHFSTPPRFEHTARERELLSTGTRYDVQSKRGRLAAWRFGRTDRPAVVLVHGWGGRGAQLGAFVPTLLEAGYQAILFDHAGHGLSDGAHSTLVHFGDGLAAVVEDAEARGSVVYGFIGHSLGAAAVSVFLNDTRRAARAVLVAPPTSVERYSGYFARRLGIAEPIRRQMQEHFERALGRRWSEFELPGSVAQVQAMRWSSTIARTARFRTARDSRSPAPGRARAWSPRRALATARSCAPATWCRTRSTSSPIASSSPAARGARIATLLGARADRLRRSP